MTVHGGPCSDGDVVHVDTNSSAEEFMFGDDWCKNVVHHGLEGRGGVRETKKHDERFVKAIACFKHRLVFVARLDADIVVSPSNVEFRVYVRAA